ncbi:MAG TPA: flagellar brake protein [Burkholderiales bacterium]|nr:flagellar brake protein [Burkholderiales bacterium]
MSDMNAPLPDSPELEKYQIYSRTEILGLLRELIERHVLLTIYFNGGSNFIVTNLLRVNPDFEELVFDCGADDATNRALLRASRFTVVSFLNHVKIQFSGHGIEETAFEGTPALRMRLPESLLRFQRREYFRTRVTGKPLLCNLPPAEKGGKPIATRILDISCGGAALAGWSGDERMKPEEVIRGCHIELPEVGKIETALEVRNISESTTPTGIVQVRVGCKFVSMAGPMMTMIQRYVNKLERSRLSRL